MYPSRPGLHSGMPLGDVAVWAAQSLLEHRCDNQPVAGTMGVIGEPDPRVAPMGIRVSNWVSSKCAKLLH